MHLIRLARPVRARPATESMRKVSLAYRIEATSTPGDEVLRRVSALGAHAKGIVVAFEGTVVALGGSVRYSGAGRLERGLIARNGVGHRARKRRCPTLLFPPEQATRIALGARPGQAQTRLDDRRKIPTLANTTKPGLIAWMGLAYSA